MNIARAVTNELLAKWVGESSSPSLVASVKKGVKAWLNSQYEAAQWSRDRSWLRGWVQDARFDTTQADLFELIRISRNFERNNALAQRLASLWEQYTVGPTGFNIVPASSDAEWNKVAKDAYDEWSEFADVASRASLGSMQCLSSRRWFFDGRSLILKTREESFVDGGIKSVRPRVQLIEAHRLATPGEMSNNEGRTIHSGIEVDPTTGRPVRYWIRDGFNGEKFNPWPAELVIDVCEPDRPWEMRPVPVLTPSLLPLHDLRDLQSMEMKAAKKAAAIAAVFKTRTGEIPKSQVMQKRLTTTGSLNTGQATTEERIRAVREFLGGEMIGIYPDEELIQPKNDRPGLVQVQYWDYLTSLVCIGVSMPKLLVFPHSMQGTVARFDMDAAASFFRSRSAVLQTAWRRIYHYFIEQESRINPKLANKPKDWRKVIVRPPRSVIADVGKNSAARLNELGAGATTFSDHYGESGEDWREKFRQRANEAKVIMELAEEYDVPPSMISNIIEAPSSIPVQEVESEDGQEDAKKPEQDTEEMSNEPERN